MFAFTIWDRAKQCLFLARDRYGIQAGVFGPRRVPRLRALGRPQPRLSG